MESQRTNQTEEQMAEVRTTDNIRKIYMRTNQTEEQREKYLRAQRELMELRADTFQNVEEAVAQCTLSPPSPPSEKQMAEVRTIEEYEQDQLCSQALDEYEDEVCTQALDEYEDQVLLNAPVDH